jgi:glyoxylase-like metal-dependent hydrolase (beta-lactamase superfamily II)
VSEPTRLADGVQRIPTTSRDNVFLVDGDDGLTLVDVGWAGAPKHIEAALAARAATLRDIRRIVITHAHPDHVKGLAALRVRTGARVLVHRADAGWLAAGRVPEEGRSGMLGRLLDRLPPLHWAPVTADAHLEDGELIPGSAGLRVIHTPGHTPGHVALLHEPSRVVLVGDAIFNRGGGLSMGPSVLSADPGARPASLARLPLEVAAVGLAHGPALRGAETDRYAELISRAARPTL